MRHPPVDPVGCAAGAPPRSSHVRSRHSRTAAPVTRRAGCASRRPGPPGLGPHRAPRRAARRCRERRPRRAVRPPAPGAGPGTCSSGSRAASVTVVSDATVPVPTENERKSSSTRRRSHSRESGAVTVLSSSAWSGWRSRRRSRSSRSATSRACSAAARAAAWSATLRAQPALPSRRSLTQLPTSMSGLIRPNSNMVGLSRTRHITTARTRGSAVAISGQLRPVTAGRWCRQPDVGDRGRGVDARPAVDAEMASPVGVGRRELAEGGAQHERGRPQPSRCDCPGEAARRAAEP